MEKPLTLTKAIDEKTETPKMESWFFVSILSAASVICLV